MTARVTNSMSLDSRLGKVIAAYIQAVEAGEKPDREAFLAAHPELASELAAFFADQEGFDRLLSVFRSGGQNVATGSLALSSAPLAAAGGQVPRGFGDYELIEEIARGGMGIVFKARNVRLDRVVALKMILAGQFATPAEVRRFRVEAENAGQLDHPHIVPLYEVGEQDGHHFFTMRLVEGGNLAAQVTRFKDDPTAAVELVTAVARAVHYAHQRGVLHRDLKPANILLDGSGHPQVTDFGLSKRLVGERELLTPTGIVGTPSYMAPEQASGAALSTAIDIFSLGAVLYELLTGRSPFRAETPFDTLVQVIEHEPTRPGALNPRVDRDLETICLKCLEKEPERRYGSAEAMAEDLQLWMIGLPIRARRIGMIERVVKWSRRRPAVAALVAVSAVAAFMIMAGLAFGYMAIAKEQGRTEKALEKYKSALLSEQTALREVRQNSYYQTIALAAPEIRANDVRRADSLLDRCPTELRRWEWFALKHLCHAELTSVALGIEPAAIAFSPDDKILATAGGALGEPGTVTIRDAVDGHELTSFRGHADTINGLAFDPSGKRLATAGRDGMVGIWDTSTTRLLLELRGHTLSVNSVIFSPDGKFVASAGDDRTIKVWDSATGREWRSFSGHTGSILALAFHRGGMLLASAGTDCDIRLWDLEHEANARALHGHSGLVRGLKFSPDGKLLASAAYDGTARLWSVETGRERFTHRGHMRYVTGIAFSPVGRYVASSSLDGTIRVWDVNSGEVAKILRGHAGGVWGLDFCSDGRRLASIGEDRSIKLWDATGLALNADIHAVNRPTTIYQASLGGGGKRLAICCGGQGSDGKQTIEVWDIPRGRLLLSSERIPAPWASVTLSPDGGTVAYAEGDLRNSQIRVLPVDSGQVRGELNRRGSHPTVMTLSSDGHRLAVVTRGNGAFLWDLDSDHSISLREDRFLSDGEISNPPRPLFDPPGRRLVLAGQHPYRPTAEALGVFDATTGERLTTIPDMTNPMAFSPDGRLLIAIDSVRSGQTARIFDVAIGREVARLQGHTGPIVAAVFSPDGDRILTASRDGTVKVWNASGRELMTLPDGGRVPTQLQFDPFDHRLVGADDNGTVFLWAAGPAGLTGGLENSSSKP